VQSIVVKWKKEYFKDPENAFSGNRRVYKEQARMAELERLVGCYWNTIRLPVLPGERQPEPLVYVPCKKLSYFRCKANIRYHSFLLLYALSIRSYIRFTSSFGSPALYIALPTMTKSAPASTAVSGPPP